MQTTTDVEEIRTKKKRTLKGYAGITLRGICMGSADVVPGVSGGTMAFILGIYEELINSIKTLGDKDFLLAVGSFKIKKALQILNWEFLLALAMGIGLAVVTLVRVLHKLLEDENQAVYVWSFFFGLVLASTFVVSKRVKQWTIGKIALLLFGASFGYILVGILPLQTPDTWWFWMLTGAIVSCALILPGISGAFLLLLLGKYEDVLAAAYSVLDGDFSQISILIFLALGAAIGLITFSKFLSWLFKQYHDFTIAFLIGLMLGSLRKIWPWKLETDWLADTAGNFILDSDGFRIPVEIKNIAPDLSTPEGVTQFVFAVVLALVGATAVILLDHYAGKKEEDQEVEVVDSAAAA